MINILWIDDKRNPNEPQWKEIIERLSKGDRYVVDWAQNYNQSINRITERGLPQIVCFDHDLGFNEDGTEKNGYDVCRFIVDYCMDRNIDIPRYYIQSSNPVGRDKINGLMSGWHKVYLERKETESSN